MSGFGQAVNIKRQRDGTDILISDDGRIEVIYAVGFNTTQERYDYTGSQMGQPVYSGYAVRGSAASAAVWTIAKRTFDGTGRVILKQTAVNVAWDDRATTASYA